MSHTAEVTLDQRRGTVAFQRIENLLRNPNSEARDQYAGEARKLPVRIMASGLGQALAFLGAKSAKREILKQLHGDLSDWVVRERLRDIAPRPAGTLLENVLHGDCDFLRWATAESLAFLSWLNRFAEANHLPSDKSQSDSHD